MPKSTILPKCDQSRLLLGELISNGHTFETLKSRVWGPMIFTLWSLLSQVYISSWLHLFCRCCWYLGRVGRMVRVQPHLVQWQEVQIPQLQQCTFCCCLRWRPNWNGSLLRWFFSTVGALYSFPAPGDPSIPPSQSHPTCDMNYLLVLHFVLLSTCLSEAQNSYLHQLWDFASSLNLALRAW